MLYANGRLGEMLGISLTRLVGSSFERFVPDSDAVAFAAACDEAALRTAHVEVELNRVDGTTFPARVALSTLPPSAGAAMSLVVSDLTEHRQHDLEERMLERLALVISTSDSVGDALEAVLLHACEYVGWPWGEAWMPEDGAAGLIRAASGGTTPPGRGKRTELSGTQPCRTCPSLQAIRMGRLRHRTTCNRGDPGHGR